uniref:RCC1-like domain-containing protein n=1 Tax=Haptolina ericina TaxID=156174 RepID=A0A7S3BM21_9EUKA
MAVSASGDVFAWGLEASGQLGLGSHRTKAPTPTKVEALSGIGVTAISCGMYHTLALTDAGEVWSVGFGGSFLGGAGGLGHGDRKQLATPEKIAAFGEDGVRAASVSAGGYHSVVLDTDGGVWSWGRGEWGRLGHNDSSDLLTPTRLEACDEMGVGTALAGEAHSACLGRDGSVHTWGRNEHWQLGYEVVGLLNSGQSFDAQQEPAAVPLAEEAAGKRAVKLAAGETGCAVLMDDDSIYLWGMQRYFVPTRLPHAITGGIADLRMGGSHVAIRTEDGRLFTYGKGTALCMPKKGRKSWECLEVTDASLKGFKVIDMDCGSTSTALILESA